MLSLSCLLGVLNFHGRTDLALACAVLAGFFVLAAAYCPDLVRRDQNMKWTTSGTAKTKTKSSAITA